MKQLCDLGNGHWEFLECKYYTSSELKLRSGSHFCRNTGTKLFSFPWTVLERLHSFTDANVTPSKNMILVSQEADATFILVLNDGQCALFVLW